MSAHRDRTTAQPFRSAARGVGRGADLTLALTVAAVGPAPGGPPAALAQSAPPAGPRRRSASAEHAALLRPEPGPGRQPVSYYVAGPGTSLYFGGDGLTFSLAAPRQKVTVPASLAPPTAANRAAAAPRPRSAVKLDFVGADPAAQPRPGPGQRPGQLLQGPALDLEDRPADLPRRAATRTCGPGSTWSTPAPAASSSTPSSSTPAPTPSRIRLAYRGPTDVQLTPDGALAVSTAAGAFLDAPPYAYQDGAAGRRP